PIAAGRRQPLDIVDIVGGQPDAIGHQVAAVPVVLAPAAGAIEQAAADVRIIDSTGVLVFELVETAAPAAVANALPFGGRHLRQSLAAPKRHIVHGSAPGR